MLKQKSLPLFGLILLLLLCLSACSSGGPDYAPQDPATDAPVDQPSTTEPSEPLTDGALPPTSVGDIAQGDGSLHYGAELYNGEQYLEIQENQQRSTAQEPVQTISLKVDTASYTNVARYLQNGSLPPADAVRVEELLNYFSYDTQLSFGTEPFSIYTELGPSPLDSSKYLAFVRIKAREIDTQELPPSSLTFLIDTSGSMFSYDKLPLLKEAFALLVETLDEDDLVSIVTYAGDAGVALDSVSGERTMEILHAINNLEAGGSTAGADGILTAYELAEKNFRPNGNNRIILATDGDFNVGVSTTQGLEDLIAEKRESGIYLSILGFGTGNTRDDIMETLSKHGNGNYAYINSVRTAQKVLVDELGANLFTIADDVKAQVEFNPANVSSYRLVGYENRALANEDFRDDTKDAGEIGMGTDVVMLFELTLAHGDAGLKYNSAPEPAANAEYADELFEVRIRYKNPGETQAQEMLQPVTFAAQPQRNSTDFNFACSVAAFGQLLRGSAYAGEATMESILALAEDSLGTDAQGYRRDHLQLLQQYRNLVR